MKCGAVSPAQWTVSSSASATRSVFPQCYECYQCDFFQKTAAAVRGGGARGGAPLSATSPEDSGEVARVTLRREPPGLARVSPRREPPAQRRREERRSPSSRRPARPLHALLPGGPDGAYTNTLRHSRQRPRADSAYTSPQSTAPPQQTVLAPRHSRRRPTTDGAYISPGGPSVSGCVCLDSRKEEKEEEEPEEEEEGSESR